MFGIKFKECDIMHCGGVVKMNTVEFAHEGELITSDAVECYYCAVCGKRAFLYSFTLDDDKLGLDENK